MYRYLVFAYYGYYPGGGMTDCELKTDDIEEARLHLELSDGDYKEIYDVKENKLIKIKAFT